MKLLLVLFVLVIELSAQRVYMTAYTSTRSQTDRSPCVSADATNICRLYRTGACIIAVSRDLRRFYPYGSKVYVEGKICIVHDTMHPRWHKRIDRYLGYSHHKMRQFKNRYVEVTRCLKKTSSQK